MKPTRRLLRGVVAGNPGNYAGLGEWRYCHQCQETFFARASQPAPAHEAHRWSSLPALDPEGQSRLAELFRAMMPQAYPPARQAELEAFAERAGWDMAYELRDGGGALTALEVIPWRKVLDAELERLIDEAERIIEEAGNA
jgi:hypothetical protein